MKTIELNGYLTLFTQLDKCIPDAINVHDQEDGYNKYDLDVIIRNTLGIGGSAEVRNVRARILIEIEETPGELR